MCTVEQTLNIGGENFRVGDSLNCFLRFIAKHSRNCPN